MVYTRSGMGKAMNEVVEGADPGQAAGVEAAQLGEDGLTLRR